MTTRDFGDPTAEERIPVVDSDRPGINKPPPEGDSGDSGVKLDPLTQQIVDALDPNIPEQKQLIDYYLQEAADENNPLAWVEGMITQLKREMVSSGEDLGYDRAMMENFINQNADGLIDYMQNTVIPGMSDVLGNDWPATLDPDHDLFMKYARNYLTGIGGSAAHAIFNPNVAGAYGAGTRTRSAGASGSRRLTPEEIRAQFDVDQLAHTVTGMYRGLILAEPKDSRSVAQAYVDTVVANPDQKLDFQTFVRNRIKKEPRYSQIYKGKPPGMSEEQFLNPYVNQATQMLRPRDVAETARAGAQLGASPQAFRERLNRDNAVTTSAPFIKKFEERMQGLAGIFRG